MLNSLRCWLIRRESDLILKFGDMILNDMIYLFDEGHDKLHKIR